MQDTIYYNPNPFIISFNSKKEPRTASKKQRSIILKKQRHCCFNCGDYNENLEVDHVIPHSVGGVTEIRNLRALCPNCHAQKSRNSNEAEKIRYAKRVKLSRCELCWTCEKIVSPYFFKWGECTHCLTISLKNESKVIKSKYTDKIWFIPTSPITSEDESLNLVHVNCFTTI